MKKRTLEKGELGFITALGMFSLICLIAALRLFIKAPTLNGEGTIPLIAAVVLLAMDVIMLFEIRGFPRGFSSGAALGQKTRELVQFLFPGMVGPIILYCLLYAVLLGLVGFPISTFAFLVGSMLTLNREHKVRTLIISAVTLACILFLFQFIFKVQLA
jgi:hypothetical protein